MIKRSKEHGREQTAHMAIAVNRGTEPFHSGKVDKLNKFLRELD